VQHRHRMFSEIGGRSERVISQHDRVFRSWLRPRLARREVVAILATHPAHGVVGSGCLWFREMHPTPGMRPLAQPYVLSMYTHPSYRGHGIARRIVRAVLRVARARGSVRVMLHASKMGRRLYRRLGFERTWEMRLWLDPSRRPTASGRPRRARPTSSGSRNSTRMARRSGSEPSGR
jgi:GNAT superfamily N-acetyltransferase